MAIPPPPPGFELDAPAGGAVPPPPPGFELDAAPAPPPAMNMRAFQEEVLKRVRAGEDPARIREWASTVRQEGDESGLLRFSIGPELESVRESLKSGYSGPVQMLDTTERNSAAGSMLRGIADTATLNFADEIQAGLETGFGLAGNYENAVRQARETRALDDPTARFTGELLGGFVPMGALARGGQLGNRVLQGIDKALDAPSFLGRTARAAGIGGAVGVGAGIGADTDGYSLGDAALDFTGGATLGAAIPAAGAAISSVGGAVRDFINPNAGALDALNDAIDGGVASLRQRIADAFQRTGKAPAIADVLTPEEAARLTGPLARSRDAKTRVLTEANTRMTNLGSDIQDQVRFTGANAPGTSLAIPGQSGRTTRPAATPGDIERATIERGDADFGAFKNQERPFSEINQIELSTKVMEPLKRVLPSAFISRMQERAERGVILGEDMDKLRRTISRLTKNPDPLKAAEMRTIQDEFLAIYQDIFPESAPAVQRYAAGMAAAEGAEIGVRAAKPSSDFIKVVDDINALKDKGRAGLPPGARAGLIAEAYGNPVQSYRLATELATNPGYQERLARALDSDDEAQALSQFALQQKTAIDSLMAMARIPTDKVESNLRNAEGLIDIVAATASGSAAFKAGVVNNMLSRLNIGKPAADKLADNLLDPAKRDAALDALERMGVKKTQWRDWVRNSFILAAGQVANNNAETPEGAISVAQPQE